MRGIIDVFAQYERAIIRQRTKAAMAVKKQRGERVSGQPPFGWKVGPDGIRLEKDEREQRVISEVLYRRVQGLTYRRIVEQLTRQGEAGRTGRPLSIVQVRNIFVRTLGRRPRSG